MEENVHSRINARGREATLIVDESAEEVLAEYTGFTKAAREKYQDACEKRGERVIKFYHLTKEGWAIQLIRYDTANGSNGEVVWRESIR